MYKTVWKSILRTLLENDKWELYNTQNDFILLNDLSSKFPDKLKKMQALFAAEAIKFRVLLIDDRIRKCMNTEIAGRPDLMAGRTFINTRYNLSSSRSLPIYQRYPNSN